jgi:hypothetical protein
MLSFRIESPRQFFEGIVTPDVSEFLDRELNHRAAYHACISLLSYRDWVLKEYVGKVWSIDSVEQAPLSKVADFQKALQAHDRSFDVVAKIANFSKHMTANNTVLNELGALGTAGFNEVPLAAVKRVFTVRIGTEGHDVRNNVRAAFFAWQKLNKENGW